MKREILCPVCVTEMKELFPEESPYPGEYVRFKKGVAKKRMSCDQCCTPINEKDVCFAFSIYSTDRPYTGWEEAYINLNGK